MNSGTFFNKNDDMNEEWFVLRNGKKLYDLIYNTAVFLHETQQKCGKTIRKSIIEDMINLIPDLEKEYPKIFTEVIHHFDLLCANKKVISPVIYDKVIKRLKKANILK